MTEHRVTTPFGRRRMSLAQMATQMAARAAPSGAVIHKWRTLAAITEAKDKLGLNDRALTVLQALVSFHQETTLSAGDQLVVFPSNKALAVRAHGMSLPTLRRAVAALVEAGVVIRRDSPNGKRYARKGRGGAIAEAFGFDLAPLVARADEFARLAADAAADRQALKRAREQVTLYRRDVAKLIEIGLVEEVPGDWPALQAIFQGLSRRIPRRASREAIEDLAGALAALAQQAAKLLEKHILSQNMSANETHNESHKQNQQTEISKIEMVAGRDEGLAAIAPVATCLDATPVRSPGRLIPSPRANGLKQRAPCAASLPTVLSACPDIIDYARGGEIRTWSDFVAAAGLARSMLGVRSDAWARAKTVVGETDASIAIAAILQKGEAIRSPGGYLRALTRKAEANQFSVGPILMALLGQQARPKAGDRLSRGP